MYTKRPFSAKTMRSKSVLAFLGSRNSYINRVKPSTINDLTLKSQQKGDMEGILKKATSPLEDIGLTGTQISGSRQSVVVKNYIHKVGHNSGIKIDVWSHHCAQCCLPESQHATSETRSRNTNKIPVRQR